MERSKFLRPALERPLKPAITSALGNDPGQAGPAAGIFDSFHASFPLYFAYSPALLIKGATKAYEALRQADATRQDFPPGTTSDTLATWLQAGGPSLGYGTVPYDQTGNARNGTDAGSNTTSPELGTDAFALPYFNFDGSAGRRWAFTGLVNFTKDKPGVTIGMNVLSQVSAQAASSFMMMFSQAGSGNSSRISLDVTGTGPFNYNARGSRTDAAQVSAVIGNHDIVTWRRLILVNDWVAATITSYMDGIRIAQGSLGATLPGGITTASAGAFIGGANTSNNCKFKLRCAVGVDQAVTGNPGANLQPATGGILAMDNALLAELAA